LWCAAELRSKLKLCRQSRDLKDDAKPDLPGVVLAGDCARKQGGTSGGEKSARRTSLCILTTRLRHSSVKPPKVGQGYASQNEVKSTSPNKFHTHTRTPVNTDTLKLHLHLLSPHLQTIHPTPHPQPQPQILRNTLNIPPPLHQPLANSRTDAPGTLISTSNIASVDSSSIRAVST
jgi:hypothetical protein